MDERRRLIVIIDDDEGVRESLTMLLEAVGHRVAAYDSAEAYLAAKPDAPACFVVDQFMPRMSGLELAATLRHVGETAPFMLISGAMSSAMVSIAEQLSVETQGKPLDMTTFLGFVEKAVKDCTA